MLKKLLILTLLTTVLSACSLGTAKVYKVHSNAELLSSKVSKELDKQEPLETVPFNLTKSTFIDFSKYCQGKPAAGWTFYQKFSIFGVAKNIIIKFKCED